MTILANYNKTNKNSCNRIDSDLSLIYLNVRSIRNKLIDLENIIVNRTPSIVCLCKTWVQPSSTNSIIGLRDYLIKIDRDY